MSGLTERFPAKIAAIAALCVLLGVACSLSAVLGSSGVGVSQLAAYFAGTLEDPVALSILANVRLPRIAAAAMAGAAFAVSGALIQGALDNPLASPNVIGVNAGAGFAVLALSAAFPAMRQFLPIAAFVGALATCWVILAVSVRCGASKIAVVLAGMAMTSVFGAGMNAILVFFPDAYVGSSTFLVGGLSGVKLSDLAVPAVFIGLAIIASFRAGRALNALSLGDEAAHSLGMKVSAVRLTVLSLAAVLAGAAVSFAGLIGFVGLMVPHLCRGLFGHDNTFLIPTCALVGSLLVVVCDTASRCVFAPYELPVGIMLAVFGGPFFLYLLLRKGGPDGNE